MNMRRKDSEVRFRWQRIAGLVIFILLAAACIFLSGACVHLFYETLSLKASLGQCYPNVVRINNLEKGYQRLLAENKKLKKDFKDYMNLVLQMQEEKAWLQTQLKEYKARELAQDQLLKQLKTKAQLPSSGE